MDKIVIKFETLPEIVETHKIVKATRGRLTLRALNYAIRKYMQEKRLIRIKRGVYSKTADPFYVAARVYLGYIGLSSALYLHRLKTEVEGSVMVCVGRPMKQLRFLDKVLVPVNLGGYAFGAEFAQSGGLELMVSTYPKTLFDMLYRPSYANYFDFYRALHTRHPTDDEWRELSLYLHKANLTTVRRAGYALEEEAPDWFIEKLREKSDAGSRVSFFFKHKTLHYSSGWNLFDDLDVKRWKDAE